MRKAGNKEKKSRGDSLLFSGMNMRKKQRRLMEISLSGIENQDPEIEKPAAVQRRPTNAKSHLSSLAHRNARERAKEKEKEKEEKQIMSFKNIAEKFYPFKPLVQSIPYLIAQARKTKIMMEVPPTLYFKAGQISLLFTNNNGSLTGLVNLQYEKLNNYISTFFFPDKGQTRGLKPHVSFSKIGFHDIVILPSLVIKITENSAFPFNKIYPFHNLETALQFIETLGQGEFILQKFIVFEREPELYRVIIANQVQTVYQIKQLKTVKFEGRGDIKDKEHDEEVSLGPLDEDSDALQKCSISSLFEHKLKIRKLDDNSKNFPGQLSDMVSGFLSTLMSRSFTPKYLNLSKIVLDFVANHKSQFIFLQIKHLETSVLRNAPSRIVTAIGPTKKCIGIFCKAEENFLLRKIKDKMNKENMLSSNIEEPFFLSKSIVTEYNKLVSKRPEELIIFPILKYYPTFIKKHQIYLSENVQLCEFCYKIYRLYYNKASINLEEEQLEKLEKVSKKSEEEISEKDICILFSLAKPTPKSSIIQSCMTTPGATTRAGSIPIPISKKHKKPDTGKHSTSSSKLPQIKKRTDYFFGYDPSKVISKRKMQEEERKREEAATINVVEEETYQGLSNAARHLYLQTQNVYNWNNKHRNQKKSINFQLNSLP